MKPEWLIEEELIEWMDARAHLNKYGREIRLVNPEGEIVGRRLAVGAITEHYLVFREDKVYTWFYPFRKPTVSVAPIPSAVRKLWTGRSLMPYRNDISSNLYGSVLWKLLERDTASELQFCADSFCSRRMVEKYRYLPRFGSGATVEWRVCFNREAPLLGREVPVCSELWWDGKLKRRHTLIHYRTATAEEQAFFRTPRNVETRRTELGRLFSPVIEYVPLLLSESASAENQ